MQDDSSDSETSSSEYESSDADEEASTLSTSYVIKSQLFVTGGFCAIAQEPLLHVRLGTNSDLDSANNKLVGSCESLNVCGIMQLSQPSCFSIAC